jgi:hypothetical protein
MPPGDYVRAAKQTYSYFVEVPDGASRPRGWFDDPASIDHYYALLDSVDAGFTTEAGVNLGSVSDPRSILSFENIAEEFKMIDESTVPVVVTAYGGPDDRTDLATVLQVLDEHPERGLTSAQRRLLNGFTVSLRREQLSPGVVEQTTLAGETGAYRWIGEYDPACGVVFEQEGASIW